MTGNQGYGVHPTSYQSLSNDQLFSMYSGQHWSGMREADRLELLQETVNRAAAAKGELGSCEVRFAPLDSRTLGQKSGSVIELNQSMFVNDKLTHVYNGRLIEEPLKASNFLALETVLHEDIHAWQDQCTDGTIQCANSGLLAEYRANQFTVSAVPDNMGGIQPGSHYLSGENGTFGYYLYYFQSSERDAHLFSQKMTAEIGERLQQRTGYDQSFADYMTYLNGDGYNAVFQKGVQLFGNPNFDKEINQVLMNQYYGVNKPVDPVIESIVKQEMAESYKAQIANVNPLQAPVSNSAGDHLGKEAGIASNAAGQSPNNSESVGSQHSAEQGTGAAAAQAAGSAEIDGGVEDDNGIE